jgi:vacuolar-type H+-ATPase subunit I/STV1
MSPLGRKLARIKRRVKRKISPRFARIKAELLDIKRLDHLLSGDMQQEKEGAEKTRALLKRQREALAGIGGERAGRTLIQSGTTILEQRLREYEEATKLLQRRREKLRRKARVLRNKT